jgi:phosphate transport system substrate-binding protein
LCSANNVFNYLNLRESNYAFWILQDKAVIQNYIDFWLYTFRPSVFGFRVSEYAWQYWLALPINLIFSSLFIFLAGYTTVMTASEVVEDIDREIEKNGYRFSSKKGNQTSIFLAALFTIFVLFTIFKWATEDSKFVLANSTNAQKSIPAVIAPNNINTSLPSTTTLSMDGSVTMVKMMKYLREGYQQINPKIQITYGLDPNGKPSDGENIRPTGSSGGLKNLIKGTVTMAASSRPLKPDEAKAGIKLVPIARDAIAVVVGINNSFKGGLTTEQLRQIYQGQITNWSQVGGADKPIKVYNRGAESGTKDFFKEQVLLGNAFAPDSNNFKTWERDETTAVLRVLADDGIYYASVFQAQGQEEIRVVPIEGIDPLNRDTIKKKVYPLSRDLYLAIPDKTSPEAKQFIEFTRSPQGQQLIEKAEFISIF